MGACLGVYLGDKIIKYAKLEQDDKTKKISLNSYGTKYVVGDKDDTLSEIVTQTGSTSTPLCLNVANYYKLNSELLKQLGKNDLQSAIELDIADYAAQNNLNEKLWDYRYLLMNSLQYNDNYTAEIMAANKTDITKYTESDRIQNVVGMYPVDCVLSDLITESNNYLILDIDEQSKMIYVSGNKPCKIIDIDISMKNILDSIAEQEGSYSKACDICKGINVFTDDESLSPDLANIIEPVIQDLLNRVKTKMDETKIKVEKIYLNGLINLFINIEVLFEQFFSISTEKMKPSFIRAEDTSANMAEIIEVNEAIALAYESLTKSNEDLNFAKAIAPKFSFKSFKLGGKKENKGEKIHKAFTMPTINKEKIESGLLFANLTAGVLLVSYAGFSAIYNAEATKVENSLTKKINAIQLENANVQADLKYVTGNKDQYAKFNIFINETVEKIRSGQIGKYSTYNVANFMQKIAKYIPSNVELQTISSDNNKTVSIVASSTSYAELGYFISQLKLQGILNNVKTGSVENNANNITVTIGGELP